MVLLSIRKIKNLKFTKQILDLKRFYTCDHFEFTYTSRLDYDRLHFDMRVDMEMVIMCDEHQIGKHVFLAPDDMNYDGEIY